jgi:hypothetical protein
MQIMAMVQDGHTGFELKAHFSGKSTIPSSEMINPATIFLILGGDEQGTIPLEW